MQISYNAQAHAHHMYCHGTFGRPCMHVSTSSMAHRPGLLARVVLLDVQLHQVQLSRLPFIQQFTILNYKLSRRFFPVMAYLYVHSVYSAIIQFMHILVSTYGIHVHHTCTPLSVNMYRPIPCIVQCRVNSLTV